MQLVIDLRRKKVKIEFRATQDEMESGPEVEVEVKMNKRQDQRIKEQIPFFAAKLMHYLIETNSVLLESNYDSIHKQILGCLQKERNAKK